MGGVGINIVIVRIVYSSLETFRFNLRDMIGAFILTDEFVVKTVLRSFHFRSVVYRFTETRK